MYGKVPRLRCRTEDGIGAAGTFNALATYAIELGYMVSRDFNHDNMKDIVGASGQSVGVLLNLHCSQ